MKKVAGLMILLHRRMSLIPNGPLWRHLPSELPVIVHDDNASEAPSAEATDSQNAFGSISSGATYSRVTSTKIVLSQPLSPETVTSEFKPLLTDHQEEALADEVFKENPVNWSQVPNLIGDVWTDEILDKEEKLLEAVQDLFPENAP
ncbi:hypothetical protein AAC387_Pa07g1999 [Persea americana]